MTDYPAMDFPGTPAWVHMAAYDACVRTGVNSVKWITPLTCMAFYESGYNPAANLCTPVESLMPVGLMQQGRNFYKDALEVDPVAHEGLGTFADPVRSFVMAIMHIDSRLTVSGGWNGIGSVDGKMGLLPRTDRGPGNALRLWLTDPAGFDREAARELYRGY